LEDRLRSDPRLWDFILHRSVMTPDLAALGGTAFEMPPRDPERPLLTAVMAALEWIGETIEYQPGFAAAPAKLEDVLARRTGNCQDLAHLLISAVRAWGYAARYVTGYQDASYAEEDGDSVQRPHAWAEVLVPGAGGRGVDPSMRLVANQTYVTVATGRDAADAMPVKGVFKGGEQIEPAATEVVVEVRGEQ
jgi:transglutaminase-like putative cysteine protease